MVEVRSQAPAPVPDLAEQVIIPMRDGVRLATDLYLPQGRGPYHVALVRLPYDKDEPATMLSRMAPSFLYAGLALVVQDVRGKFRSEGETRPYVNEISDAWDTLEWIEQQPWASGAVGMFGDSYYGWTQWAAVASQHRALKAIAPRVAATSMSCERLSASWATGVVSLYAVDYFAHYWVDQLDHEYDVDWSHRPLIEVFDPAFEAIGARSFAVDAVTGRGPALADPFAELRPLDVVKVPVLHLGGWFDNIAPQQMRDFMYLQGSTPLQYLRVDSTDHEMYHLHDVPITPDNDLQLNKEALARFLPGYVEPIVEFLRDHLDGAASGRHRPVATWHLGHVGWHTDDAWPPPKATEVRLSLASSPGMAGRLEPPDLTPSAWVRWEHDPEALVPSSVRDPFSLIHEYPDERAIAERPDVQTFTSDASGQPLDIAGPIDLTVVASATSPSVALFAKLLDVSPDGEAHQLVRGERRLLGAEYEAPVRIPLGHLGYRLRPGHRLRVQISASDFPLFLPDPGDGTNPWLTTKDVRSGISLLTGDVDGTFLSLMTTPGRAPDDAEAVR